jgi:DNA-binding transcriptional LysR family regulator
MDACALTVQVPVSFGQRLIAPALPRLLAAHPEMRVTVIEAASAQHWVREPDVAVCIGPVVDQRRVVRQIGVVHPVTCASAEYIGRTGTPQAPSDLMPSDCVALLEPRTRQPQDWAFRRGQDVLRISPAAPLAFVNPETALAAATRGGGYVRVRCFEAEQQIAAGLLQAVLEDWNDLPWPVTLVRPRGRTVRPEAVVFGEFVAGLLPSYDRSSATSVPMPASRTNQV